MAEACTSRCILSTKDLNWRRLLPLHNRTVASCRRLVSHYCSGDSEHLAHLHSPLHSQATACFHFSELARCDQQLVSRIVIARDYLLDWLGQQCRKVALRCDHLLRRVSVRVHFGSCYNQVLRAYFRSSILTAPHSDSSHSKPDGTFLCWGE